MFVTFPDILVLLMNPVLGGELHSVFVGWCVFRVVAARADGATVGGESGRVAVADDRESWL